MPTSPRWRRRWAGSGSSRASRRSPPSGSRRHSRWPSRWGCPRCSRRRVNTKAMILSNRGRNGESGALVRYALDVALEHDIPSAAFRAYNNVADLEARGDRFEAAATGYRDGLALARRVGHRQQEWLFLGQTYPQFMLGHWDEALSVVGRDPRGRVQPDAGSRSSATSATASPSSPTAASWRRPSGSAAGSPSCASRPTSASGRPTAGRSRRCCSRRAARPRRWRVAEEAWELRDAAGISVGGDEGGVPGRGGGGARSRRHGRRRAAAAHGRAMRAPAGAAARSGRRRCGSGRGWPRRQGDGEQAERLFRGAAGLFRELATPFPMAVTLLEHAEWLVAQGRGDEAGDGARRGRESVRAAGGDAVAGAGRARCAAGDVVAH